MAAVTNPGVLRGKTPEMNNGRTPFFIRAGDRSGNTADPPRPRGGVEELERIARFFAAMAAKNAPFNKRDIWADSR
jgi:ABC-type nitrate/sulfonate/bicarbonate transport system substrate-binding protein